jgi:hypothetical protein
MRNLYQLTCALNVQGCEKVQKVHIFDVGRYQNVCPEPVRTRLWGDKLVQISVPGVINVPDATPAFSVGCAWVCAWVCARA